MKLVKFTFSLSESVQVAVLGHKADTVLGERLQEQAWQFGMREKVDAVSMTSYLEDGDVVKVGEGELYVLHVPGHSPGSIALYDKEGGYVISGDALFYRSIGRTDLPGGDHDTLVNAVKNQRDKGWQPENLKGKFRLNFVSKGKNN